MDGPLLSRSQPPKVGWALVPLKTDAEDVEEKESIFETSVATEVSDIRNLNNEFQLMKFHPVNGVLLIGHVTFPNPNELPPPDQVFTPPPLPLPQLLSA